VPGHRGRKHQRTEGNRFPIKYLHEYLAKPLPAPSYPVNVSGGITDWGMLGNGPDPTCTTHPDGVGDCTFAGRQHLRMAKAAANGETETWETSDQLVAEYLAYDHGRDAGAVIADLLLSWYKAGKILAFAPVDHGDRAMCDSAMARFNGLYAGVELTGDADQLFSEGRPWTVAHGERPDPDEGHCIVKVKAEGGSGLDEWVTWGALQGSTPVWTAECLVEAWAVVTSEDQMNPAELAALRADIDALGGTGGQPAPPAPVPTPTPDQPTPADVAFAAVLNGTDRPGHPWIDEHHEAYNHRVQMAARTWLASKNLLGD
jgi:hypothetical protein